MSADLAALRGEMEAAIEAARLEGRREALRWAYEEAEHEADEHGSTWGFGSAGHKALWRVANKLLDAARKAGWDG